MSRRHLAPLRGWDWQFDSGSAVTVADDTGKIRITPKAHWDSKWAWWCIRSDRMGGTTPHFLIAKASHYNLVANEWVACWATAADTPTWNLFDNVSIGASDLEFYHNTPFPTGRIYVAAMPMYPYRRTERLVSEWFNNSLVSALASVGQATRRDNADGRTAAGYPYLAFKLTNATGGTKNVGLLTSGNHPSENIGRWMLEGAVEWLLSTSWKQKFLLDYFAFYVYPTLNPQGIGGGWFRSSPQTPTDDNNRLWNTTGTNEAVDAFKAAWTAHISDVFEVAFDYHSWMVDDGAKSLAYDSTTTIWVAFLAKMAALDATFVKRTDDTTASMLGNYWRSLATTKLAGSIDHGGVTSLGVTNWKACGQKTMIALADLQAAGYFTNGPGVGSRDFNGTTDRIDWANFYSSAGVPISISAWIYSDGVADTNSDYICQIQNTGDAAYGTVFYTRTTIAGQCRQIGFTANGATDILRISNEFADIVGSCHHVLVTFDGTFTDATKIHIYLDNTELTYAVSTNGVTEDAHAGKFCIGGRTYDDARNFDGKIAQVGVWNRVLTAGEIADLAAGYAPDLAAASDLLFYFKGNTSSLVATPPSGGSTGTADGTTSVTGVGNGPSIVYG